MQYIIVLKKYYFVTIKKFHSPSKIIPLQKSLLQTYFFHLNNHNPQFHFLLFELPTICSVLFSPFFALSSKYPFKAVSLPHV